MKPAIPLIAGVVLIITPQTIMGVVAANTAWVHSSYLRSVAQVETHGIQPSNLLRADPLPSMPLWMTLTSIGLGIALCGVGLWQGFRTVGSGGVDPSQ